LYINDLTERLHSDTFGKLYADDTKLIRVIKDHGDVVKLQNDLDSLHQWTIDWLVKFNDDKCKIMHLGLRNSKPTYTMKQNNSINVSRSNLAETSSERDLGVIISNDLKWKQQVTTACGRANRILGQIRNSFSHFNVKSTKQLYTSMVRPHLEYANPVWYPHLAGDCERLERVQHRATKTPCLRHLSYPDRLHTLGLTTLADRRMRGDLIQMYKMVKGIDHINLQNPPQFQSTERSNRFHNMRLRREVAKKSSARHNYFTNRIAVEWNKLPQEVIDSETTTGFKNKLSKFNIFC
jgi:hypothetical protein